MGAISGTVQNVIVKRFGAVGEVPGNYFNAAGTETFPVTVFTGDEPDKPQTPAWVIEQVEVSDIRSRHGGYGTMIMPLVLAGTTPADTDPAAVIEVRGCVVRNNPQGLAFGTAATPVTPTPPPAFGLPAEGPTWASRKILFKDNVVLNNLAGLNTDTGAIGWIRLVNNAFLDVVDGANLGEPGSNPPPPTVANHRNYTFQDNLYRLRGRINVPIYRNYDAPYPPATMASDPNLALGRPYLSQSKVLNFSGRADNIIFQNNWLTTWPEGSFYWPSLGTPPTSGASGQEVFHLIWAVPPGIRWDNLIEALPRYPAQNVTLDECRWSTDAFVFTPETTELAGGSETPIAALAATSQPPDLPPAYAGDYIADYQNELRPKPAGTFVPQGRVERVQPGGQYGPMLPAWEGRSYSPASGFEDFKHIREVVFGSSSLSGNTLTVNVRLMEHTMPSWASAGTVGINLVKAIGWSVQVFAELADGSPPTNITPVTPQLNTVGGGFATITQNVGTNPIKTNCVIRLKAWHDYANARQNPPNDVPTTLDEGRFAWASHQIYRGNVIEVFALPDVGDDKNTYAGKKAKFLVKRTSPANAPNPLTLAVKVELPLGVWTKPTGGDLTATYGTTGTADYYLTGGNFRPSTDLGDVNRYWVDIPAPAANATETTVELTVNTRADNLTEANAILLKLVPQPTTAKYAVGPASQADVLIYDGPEFTLYELNDTPRPLYGGYQSMSSLEVNALNTKANPKIAGVVNYTPGQYPAAVVGGYWLSTATYAIVDVWGTRLGGSSPSPKGIADSDLLVGLWNSRAFRRIGGTETMLPPTTGNSGAYGVNPAGTDSSHYIVGFSPAAGESRPAVWVNGGNPKDLVQNLPGAGMGKAYAVNDSGEVVGASLLVPGGISQPFRSKTGAAYLASGDELPVPAGAADETGAAQAISPEGLTVGRYATPLSSKTGAFWLTRSGASPNLQGVPLGTWRPVGGAFVALSEALGVTRVSGADWIVGWSGGSDTQPVGDPDSRAVFIKGSGNPWRDLNDKLFTHGLSGWKLKKATAINRNGWIAGTGYLNGAPRGFLLVPRTPGQ